MKRSSTRPGSRAERVAELVRAEIADVVLRGRLRDPLAKDVVISGVKLTPDLQQAYVYVRVLQEADDQRQTAVVEAMNRAAGFLRREIAPKLQLRRVPELTFFWDAVIDRAQRLDAIFAEIESDTRPSASTSDSTAVPAAGAVDSESE